MYVVGICTCRGFDCDAAFFARQQCEEVVVVESAVYWQAIFVAQLELQEESYLLARVCEFYGKFSISGFLSGSLDFSRGHVA